MYMEIFDAFCKECGERTFAGRKTSINGTRCAWPSSSPVEMKLFNVQRCVAALDFGLSWQNVLHEFNQLTGNNLRARIRSELMSKAAEREVKRLLSIPIDDLESLTSPVISFEIPKEYHQ